MKKNRMLTGILIILSAIALILTACPDSNDKTDNKINPGDELGTITISGDLWNANKPWIGGRLTVDTSALGGGDSSIDYVFIIDNDEDYAIPRPNGTYDVVKNDHGKKIRVKVQRLNWDEETWVYSEEVGPVINGWSVKTLVTKDHKDGDGLREPFIGLRSIAVDSNDMVYTVGRRGQAGNAYLWRIDPSKIDPETNEPEIISIANTLSGAPRFLAIDADNYAVVPRMWYYWEIEKYNTATGAMTRISENILNKLQKEYTTIGGTGSNGITTGATSVPFADNALQDVAVDKSGNIYLTTGSWHGCTVLKVTPAGPESTQASWDSTVTVLAGSTQAGAGGGTTTTVPGTGTNAKFRELNGITVGPDNNVYVGDGYGSGAIWKINSLTGEVTRFVGGGWGYSDGIGAAAKFTLMGGMTFGRDGNFYVTDRRENDTMPIIRKITPQGVVTTIAGNPNGDASSRQIVDGLARTEARFRNLWGVAADSKGNVYIIDDAMDNNPSVIRMIYFDEN